MPLVVPTGSPVWVRTTDYSHYGGHASKENYLGRGAIDALTDVAAEEFSRMVADAASFARTAPFAVFEIQCSDTSPAAPTILYAALMTGVASTSYLGSSPPAGFPSFARNGNGHVTATFASSYSDEYGIAGAYVPRAPVGTLWGSSAGDVVAVVSGQTVVCRAFDVGGSALVDPKFTLAVS